ncbi:copper amine oxidase N-terminal domain-containing protein [Paenibacillus gallinarum]|uniref:Copper amine oxidase N-terminal domain-containing protein n=1 Tax=Paenibacillus gallinarum TaxID=2762232 RepID=A0ABR8SST3_9BACL|nr:copper amine oxidase N-terminal domain-containing protein [Paenibacillus gallinarum]MBD7966465.1 copper amine oxidase N-terminal domain-containing protein [Paenibacillus gallinarum]
MKKVILSIMLGSLVFASLPVDRVEAAGATSVEVLLNTKKMSFPDAKPFQDSQGSVMVPIRFVSEALGAKVSYSKSGKTTVVGVTNKDHTVKMTVGQTTALIDGKKKSYGTKIILKQNRTFVPLRLVSEGLGQKVEWDKIGRWVWIGEKNFRSTDDKEFKLSPLSDFKSYFEKTPNRLSEKTQGVKVIKMSDFPIRLGSGQVIYSIEMVKRNGENFIAIRSSERGNPIDFLIKNDYIKGRNHVDNAFQNNSDKTGTNFYPIISSSDHFQNGKFVENYDYTKFKLSSVDYISFRTDDPDNYIVMVSNPFK